MAQKQIRLVQQPEFYRSRREGRLKDWLVREEEKKLTATVIFGVQAVKRPGGTNWAITNGVSRMASTTEKQYVLRYVLNRIEQYCGHVFGLSRLGFIIIIQRESNIWV